MNTLTAGTKNNLTVHSMEYADAQKMTASNQFPKIKLLHVVTDMNPIKGGVCHSVRTMIAGLTELGVENEVVCVDEIDAPWLANSPFTINNLGVSRGVWFYHSEYVSWLVKNMPRFDVVIVHGLWLYHGYATRKALKIIRQTADKAAGVQIPKLFVMPHGMLDPYFQKSGGRKIKAIRNWLYWKIVEGKIINKANGLLFTSDEEKRLAGQSFHPYHPLREPVVGLGAEQPPAFINNMADAFAQKCPGLLNQPYILFLSRIHEKKGVDLLTEAYKQIVRKCNEVGYKFPKLIIAGPGLETEYGMRIQNQVETTPEIKDEFFFPGMLNGDAKWGAFYGCEAFILPSHQENFGYAVVEALACGKPVLISNQINIWRPIENSGGGFVEDDSFEGVYNLLSKWASLPAKEKLAMGLQAKQCFEKEFAVGPASQRILEAIIS